MGVRRGGRSMCDQVDCEMVEAEAIVIIQVLSGVCVCVCVC